MAGGRTFKVALPDDGDAVLLHLQLLERVQRGQRLRGDGRQQVAAEVQPLQLPAPNTDRVKAWTLQRVQRARLAGSSMPCAACSSWRQFITYSHFRDVPIDTLNTT